MKLSHYAAVALCAALIACSGKPEPAAPSPKAEAAATSPTLALTPENAKIAGVETAVAGPADIRQTLTLYGSIRPNAERQQEVRARYPGVVRTVAKRPGDAVALGELLLSIESNDSLEPYAIRSPISGTVLNRSVNPGQSVGTDTPLLTVADLSSVWAEFAVFANDLNRVRAGQAVATRAGEGAVEAQTRIAYVAPAGDSATRSVVARAVIDNRDGRWVAGQFVTGDVVIEAAQVPVAVVPAALQQVKDQPTVFVATATGFEARTVAVGRRGAEVVEIVKGLSAGERYVAKNSFVVKAEVLKGEAEED